MKKKLRIFFLAIFTICFFASSVVYADKTNEGNVAKKEDKVVYSKKEIKEIERLEKKAKRESLINPNQKSEGILVNDQTGEKLKTESYSTKQLLKVVEKPNGEVEEHYAVTSFTEVPNIGQIENEEVNKEEVKMASSGGFIQSIGNDFANNIFNKNNMNLALTTYDSSYSLKVWSTNYITQTSNQLYITKTTGGWSRLDSSVSITFSSFGVYQNGFTWDTNKYIGQVANPSKTSSWNYSVTTRNWKAVRPNNPHSVGITASFNLKRGTRSSWSHSHVNRMTQEF